MKLQSETREIDSLLRNINKLLVNYTKKQLAKYNLTLPRFHTLWMISKFQPVNMGSLHEEMLVAGSTLTIIVDYLVEKNIVKRYRCKDDRRVVLLEVTEQGEELVQSLLEERQSFLQQALLKLGTEEQKSLINLLKPVYESLETQSKEVR